MTLEINKIYNMDCVEGMRMLPDNFIDLTVTSPPYDDLRQYKGFEWDFEATAQELYRVTCEGGTVVWVVGDATVDGSETGTSFRQALYFKDVGFNLHDTMIYAKNNPVPNKQNRYQQQFEYMFVFTKGRVKTFNPIMRQNKYAGEKIAGTFRHEKDELTKMTERVTKAESIENNIWWYSVGKCMSTLDEIAHRHPAVFPEELARDHIISWSNEGDLILDPFMGSGTTAKVAMHNNRNFIGFELSSEYCEIAELRIGQRTDSTLPPVLPMPNQITWL